jgi:hypothetical protein
VSEAKAEFEKRFGGMTPDHPCVPDVWMNGFEAGKESRDGLRKAVVDMMLELLETAVDANAYDTVWKTGAKALEADGDGI